MSPEKFESNQEKEPRKAIIGITQSGGFGGISFGVGMHMSDNEKVNWGIGTYNPDKSRDEEFRIQAAKFAVAMKERGVSEYEISADYAIDPPWMKRDMDEDAVETFKKMLEEELNKIESSKEGQNLRS